MKLRSPGLWIGLLSTVAVLYFVLSDFGRTSPGPLATVHERVPELTGFRSCAQCHGGWFSDMHESCLRCHQDVGAQIEAGLGLHGVVGKARTAACGMCHGDHHGSDFHVVNRQSFALAGVPNPAQFDHDLVGYRMRGKHLELECAKCHANAEVQPLPAGERRYLGLRQDCGSCHKDPHEGRMVLRCEQCHGQDSFKVLESTGHDRFLALIGGHAQVACSACHREGDPHGLERLGTQKQRLPRLCQDCHESPHQAQFVQGAAKLAAMAPAASCVACHAAEHLTFRDERLQLTTAQHTGSGFPLDVPHDQVKCADCHAPKADFAGRYPGRKADTCATCHRDPHGGQFVNSAFAANGCLGCHDRRHFDPPAFDREQHEHTRFPLTGSHIATECRSCHLVPGQDLPRVFHDTKSQCAACHEDSHRGCFASLATPPGASAPSDCGQCHLTTHFSELPPAGFDHARWTGFAIRGAHAQAACETCHPRGAEPDAQKRTFGRVAEHFGAFTGCVTCHRDVHEGGFDAATLPREVAGRRDCARCHVETSFRTFPNGFEHGAWTGFALQGAHAKAECSACHPVLPEAEASGRTWTRARGVDCTDCHRDAHAGQFDVAGRTDCKRCHRTGDSFADLSFRHDLDSRFRLGEAHDKLACAACHKPVRIGGVEVTRFRPLGFECSDCHGAQEDPLHRPRVRRQ